LPPVSWIHLWRSYVYCDPGVCFKNFYVYMGFYGNFWVSISKINISIYIRLWPIEHIWIKLAKNEVNYAKNFIEIDCVLSEIRAFKDVQFKWNALYITIKRDNREEHIYCDKCLQLWRFKVLVDSKVSSDIKIISSWAEQGESS